MARNTIRLRDLVDDFLLGIDQDDYIKYQDPIKVLKVAREAVRNLQLDTLRQIKSLRLEVDTSTKTVAYPEDYIAYTKVGYLDDNCNVILLGLNNQLNISSDLLLDNNDLPLLDSDGIEITSATVCEPTNPDNNDLFYYEFRNYQYNNSYGRLFGIGGGNNAAGYFRPDNENSEFKLDIASSITHIILEYVADVTMQADPYVTVDAEDAVKAYMYYQLIRFKASVPVSEKERARLEWAREKRLATKRTQSFTPAEAMATMFRRYTLAPKTEGIF